MRPVTVLILHPPAAPDAPPPVRWLAAARDVIAERQRQAFEAAGAEQVLVVREPLGDRPFGARIRSLVREILAAAPAGRRHGLVVIGSGAMPLARESDFAEFVRVGHGIPHGPLALANSFFSADAIAISEASVLLDVPDLPADNALPRWLSERAGISVRDRRTTWRLAVDIDSPLDVLLVAGDPGSPPGLATVADAIAAGSPDLVTALKGVAATLEDRRGELLVTGRTSARTIRWLEGRAACRVRALIEERGLRSRTPLALDDQRVAGDPERAAEHGRSRPPRSLLGLLLDEAAPKALVAVVRQLADAALIDTRVLIAHRRGSDEARWPRLADRLASDVLQEATIGDAWLREVTRRVREARLPIVLGGHTLVGPGLPLIPAAAQRLASPAMPPADGG